MFIFLHHFFLPAHKQINLSATCAETGWLWTGLRRDGRHAGPVTERYRPSGPLISGGTTRTAALPSVRLLRQRSEEESPPGSPFCVLFGARGCCDDEQLPGKHSQGHPTSLTGRTQPEAF